MVRILLLFLLAVFTFGANLEPVFLEFDRNFDILSKQKKLKIHKQLKDIYVKSLINNDLNLKKESLARLIKSSKVLNLDHEIYQDEFDKKELKKPKDLKSNSPYLVLAQKSENGLVLKFNQEVDSKNIKIFSLIQKPYFRNVADIAGIINGKPISIKNFLVDEIYIAQNNKSTIRVVMRSKIQKTLKAEVLGNLVILSTSDFLNKKKTNDTAKQISIPKEDKFEKTAKTKPSKAIVSGKIVVIDPGHGGNDPGAVNGKLQEKTAVLEVGKKLAFELNKRGYKVFFTRESDKFINLRTRTKFANDKNADLFVSIHANAAPNAQRAKVMRGIETFFLSPARSERSKNAAALENKSDIEEMNFFSKETFLNFLNREKIIASNKLGIDMQSQILKSIKSKKFSVVDGGVREAPFWVLVGALMPAVLIEIGYITHPEEGKLLFNKNYQEALAKGIANGVDEYFAKNR